MSTTGRAFLGAVATVFALPIVIVLALSGGGGTGGTTLCGTPVNVGQVLPSGATLTQEMADNAGVVIRVGGQLSVDRQGLVIALATALVESGLYNLDHGDRDSLGLFQQRPSQGWGTPEQIMDPVYSSTQFFNHLLAIPNWHELDPGAAAQRVQRSAYPDRYGQRMSDAVSILGGAGGSAAPTPTPTPGGGSVTPSPGGGSVPPGPTPNPSPGPAPTPSPNPSPGGGSATPTPSPGPGTGVGSEANLCGPAVPGTPGTLAEVAAPAGGTITVAAQIAEPLQRLLAAAEADGVVLGGGGYRSAEQQIELRRQHCGSSHYDIYEKPSDQCSPPTARPGRSMHEVGLAIDFTCGSGGSVRRGDRCDTWLLAHASTYGLHNLPSEAWHYSTTGT